jgi:tetratricopeptide (TPR) repeat protein
LFLATCPAVQFQDADRSLKLARRALQLSPMLSEGWRVLGVAECRAGHWAAAIEALEKWGTFNPEEDPSAGFAFAIAHGRLGHMEDARKWYDRAAELMNERGRWHEDLSRLRAEAAAVLDLPMPAAPDKKEAPRPAKG